MLMVFLQLINGSVEGATAAADVDIAANNSVRFYEKIQDGLLFLNK